MSKVQSSEVALVKCVSPDIQAALSKVSRQKFLRVLLQIHALQGCRLKLGCKIARCYSQTEQCPLRAVGFADSLWTKLKFGKTVSLYSCTHGRLLNGETMRKGSRTCLHLEQSLQTQQKCHTCSGSTAQAPSSPGREATAVPRPHLSSCAQVEAEH